MAWTKPSDFSEEVLSGIVSQQIQTEIGEVLLYLLPYIPSLLYFSPLMISDYAPWRSYKNNTALKNVKICQRADTIIAT